MPPKRPKQSDAASRDDESASYSEFTVERAMTGLKRALEGREFTSPGDADVYVNRILDDGTAEQASAPRTPLERAQDLMYDAWDATDEVERISLAEVALEQVERRVP